MLIAINIYYGKKRLNKLDNRQIGIFDSGIGGLSVLHQAIKDLPNEKYLYYADVDNVPYGSKTNEQIKEYVEESVKFMMDKNVKVIVIACNTATSFCVESLRNKYSIPIIGIEPAVKPAIEINKEKRIMLIATPVTVREKKLKRLLKQVDKKNKVDLIALPGLVKFAEKEEFDSENVKEYLKEEFKNIDINNYSEIILGCTHFNYFKNIFRILFSNKINIIDGNQGIIYRLESVLYENNLLGNEEQTSIDYYLSGRLVKEKNSLKKIERLHKRLEEMLNS